MKQTGHRQYRIWTPGQQPRHWQADLEKVVIDVLLAHLFLPPYKTIHMEEAIINNCRHEFPTFWSHPSFFRYNLGDTLPYTGTEAALVRHGDPILGSDSSERVE